MVEQLIQYFLMKFGQLPPAQHFVVGILAHSTARGVKYLGAHPSSEVAGGREFALHLYGVYILWRNFRFPRSEGFWLVVL